MIMMYVRPLPPTTFIYHWFNWISVPASQSAQAVRGYICASYLLMWDCVSCWYSQYVQSTSRGSLLETNNRLLSEPHTTVHLSAESFRLSEGLSLLKMRHRISFALILWQVICPTFGQDFRTFLDVHTKPIENYIMEGYGNGWTNCDLMSIMPIPNQSFMLRRQFVMDMERIKTLDMRSLLSFSSCLLIAAKAQDHETISKLTQFGWSSS